MLVALTAIVSVIVVLILNFLVTPRYQSTARFLISPIILEDPGDLVDSTEALDNATLVANYAEVFNSPTLQRQAASRMAVEEVSDYEFSSVILPETSVVQVTVTGPDANVAAQLANLLGEEVIAYMQPFSTLYQVRELDPALVTETPASPRILPDVAVALVLGTIAGIFLVIGLSYLPTLAGLPNPHPVTETHATQEQVPRDPLPAHTISVDEKLTKRPSRTETI